MATKRDGKSKDAKKVKDSKKSKDEKSKDGKKSKHAKKSKKSKVAAKAKDSGKPKVGKDLEKHFRKAVKRWGSDVVLGLLAAAATQLVAGKVKRARTAAAAAE